MAKKKKSAGEKAQIKAERKAKTAAENAELLKEVMEMESSPEAAPEKPKGGNGGNGNGGSNGSSKEETSGGNAADVMAAQLGRGASVSSETLVKVRNYNRLNQEEWDYLHSEEIQGQLADLIDSNGGDLQETYNQLAAKYGERAAAQIIATANDGYFEK